MTKNVLFICTHNSARSLMAEGLLMSLYPDRYKAYSAGTQPAEVNAHAVKVMAEIGIDISGHRLKSVEEFQGIKFDYVLTVCDNARETCPFFPGGNKYIHKSFEDPSEFNGIEDEILTVFKRVRDEIRDWIEKIFGGEDE